MANLRLFRGPATEFRCPIPLAGSAAEVVEELGVVVSDWSVLTDHLAKVPRATGYTRDDLSVGSTALFTGLSGRVRRLRTGRSWGENHQPQAEKSSRRPTSNAHAIPQMIIHRACLVRESSGHPRRATRHVAAGLRARHMESSLGPRAVEATPSPAATVASPSDTASGVVTP